MNFDIPDWGGGDCFSYYTDLPTLSETCSKVSGNKLTKVKKRLKKKGDQASEDFHVTPKKRKIDVTNSSIKQNDVGLGANQTKPLLSPKRSPEKKKKEKKIHQTGDSEGREVENEATSKISTCGNSQSVGHTDEVVSPKTSQKKKNKKKKNNKYKELNTEQRKFTPQGNAPTGVQDVLDDSASCNVAANINVTCGLKSQTLDDSTALLQQQEDEESKVCDKEKNEKRKKKRVKRKNNQTNGLEKCTVQSENASEQHNTTETEKSMHVLSSESGGMNTKNTNKKQAEKSKKSVKKRIVAKNETGLENKVNININDNKKDIGEAKSKVVKKTFEKGKKSNEVKNENQNKQTKDKKQKKSKRNNESTEDVLINDQEKVDPEFQSDFKALLKELNFGRFHSPEQKEGRNVNESSITSALDSELNSSKDPSNVPDENGDSDDNLEDSEIEEEDGPSRANIRNRKVDLGNGNENFEDDGDEDMEVDDGNQSDGDGKTGNIEGSLKYEETHNTGNKKVKEKKVDEQKSEGQIDTHEESGAKSNERKKFDKNKLARILDEADTVKRLKEPVMSSVETLKQKMINRLAVARFRMVNEELYTSSSTDSSVVFKDNHEAFTVYHAGYQSQVKRWPVNPLDLIVTWLSNKSKEWVVADFGCGEAALSLRVPQKKVHSLDLVSANSRVTSCNMAHSPLQSASVDVVVFCLSLMSSNIKDFIVEANRVLREGGIMKVAEVESRFGDVQQFVNLLGKFGFHCTHKDTSQTYFFLFEFKKNRKLKKMKGLPDIILKPCIYKKR